MGENSEEMGENSEEMSENSLKDCNYVHIRRDD